jgi:hypothetical protein
LKKIKTKSPTPPDRMTTIQGQLQELLEQGRRLRQQIESISADVDFPLTRDSDGDPRLRNNPSHPDPVHGRPRKRRARG